MTTSDGADPRPNAAAAPAGPAAPAAPVDETITTVVPADLVRELDALGQPENADPLLTEVVPSAAVSVPSHAPIEASRSEGRRGQREAGPRFLGRAFGRTGVRGDASVSAAAPAAAPAVAPEFLGRPGAPAPVAVSTSAAGPILGGDPSTATPSVLDARLISAWFGDHQVLQDVSLTMPAGRVTALIGPSGCGKSTFLRILNRMHELVPSATLAGEVLLDGEDIYDAGLPVVEARKRIGMVFQKPNPFPAMSIYDNVLAGLALTGVRADRDRKDFLVESCLTKAGLWNELKDRLRSPGGGLSGGQQQRLCIARSLAVRPRILLMDEPCSALDPTSTRVIEETMLELAHEVTIVIVTHNMQQAQRVSDQCAFFLASQGQPGHIVEYGDTDAMFASPIDPRTHDYVNGRFG
ncbi:MAG: phosphate transporter ATP-binding protein [Microbacterium sp.]|jgi:phosphate transport system ATP-binding protein|nr:phosphate transporter ATP-binding protein [Microbacterium sp.]